MADFLAVRVQERRKVKPQLGRGEGLPPAEELNSNCII